jgi:phage FluMu protein gp41
VASCGEEKEHRLSMRKLTTHDTNEITMKMYKHAQNKKVGKNKKGEAAPSTVKQEEDDAIYGGVDWEALACSEYE